MDERTLDNIISEVDQQIIKLKREGIIPNTIFVSEEDYGIYSGMLCNRWNILGDSLYDQGLIWKKY